MAIRKDIHGVPYQDFLVCVAMGQIPGASVVTVAGHTQSLGTAMNLIWTGSNSGYEELETTSKLEISSTNSNDVAGGSGANAVLLELLDTNYDTTYLPVLMNGLNAVETSAEYIRVQSVIVTSAGASGWNEGNLWVGTGSLTLGQPARPLAHVEPTVNMSSMAKYTVPRNHTYYLLSSYLTSGKGKEVEIAWFVKPEGGVALGVDDLNIYESQLYLLRRAPARIEEKTDIVIKARTDVAGASVSISGESILIDESY